MRMEYTNKDKYTDGRAIISVSDFKSSKAEYFIVYAGTRTLKSKEEVKTWNKDVLLHRIKSGQLLEAEEKEECKSPSQNQKRKRRCSPIN